MCESVCVSEEQGKPILYGNEISKTLHRSPVWCLSVCVCVCRVAVSLGKFTYCV